MFPLVPPTPPSLLPCFFCRRLFRRAGWRGSLSGWTTSCRLWGGNRWCLSF